MHPFAFCTLLQRVEGRVLRMEFWGDMLCVLSPAVLEFVVNRLTPQLRVTTNIHDVFYVKNGDVRASLEAHALLTYLPT